MRGSLLRSCMAFLMGAVISIAGVSAIWTYATLPVKDVTHEANVPLHGFVYAPEEMPKEEVTVVQRLLAILNRLYQTDTVQDSRDYLLNETIQVYWGGDKTQDPFVGSMDNTFKPQIDALFEDVLFESGVSFILKNQDLNNDGRNEIAMYSTSDPLDNRTSSYDGVVCVYVTVFTPVISSSGQITGYRMVCESLRGYCSEIYYSPSNNSPSFSTDTWRDSVCYVRNNRKYELSAADKLNFNKYNDNYVYNNRKYNTEPMGNSLSTLLRNQL